MGSVPLSRRLGLGDAIAIGLGSMIGAGVFSVWAPAAQSAGAGLVIGLAIAAVVAYGNATSTAQLAAAHAVSGGAYAYGRAELGPWWGFTAGWCFVIGKTASCAAMALTFAAYAVPAAWQRPVAVVAVVALTTVTLLGVTRTARVTQGLVLVTLTGLAVVVAAAIAGQEPGGAGAANPLVGGPYGVLQSAGLLFFAFAGYARVATMGEEVREPARTIPRAIVIALTATVGVYAVVAAAVLLTLGPEGAASSTAPLADVVVASGWAGAAPVVTVAAATASLGALLALLAGVSRTMLAMARESDLPRFLAAVHPARRVPHRAQLVVGLVIVVLVLVADLRTVIGFSSFGVLLYYLVANAAALRQRGDARRYPRALQVVGAAGCLALALTLPWPSVAGGVAVVAVGVGARAIRVRFTRAA